MQDERRYVLTTRGNASPYGESVDVYLLDVSPNGARLTYVRELADHFSKFEALAWQDRLGSWWLRVQRVPTSKGLTGGASPAWRFRA